MSTLRVQCWGRAMGKQCQQDALAWRVSWPYRRAKAATGVWLERFGTNCSGQGRGKRQERVIELQRNDSGCTRRGCC